MGSRARDFLCREPNAGVSFSKVTCSPDTPVMEGCFPGPPCDKYHKKTHFHCPHFTISSEPTKDTSWSCLVFINTPGETLETDKVNGGKLGERMQMWGRTHTTHVEELMA